MSDPAQERSSGNEAGDGAVDELPRMSKQTLVVGKKLAALVEEPFEPAAFGKDEVHHDRVVERVGNRVLVVGVDGAGPPLKPRESSEWDAERSRAADAGDQI